jgi:hypothetical protein
MRQSSSSSVYSCKCRFAQYTHTHTHTHTQHSTTHTIADSSLRTIELPQTRSSRYDSTVFSSRMAKFVFKMYIRYWSLRWRESLHCIHLHAHAVLCAFEPASTGSKSLLITFTVTHNAASVYISEYHTECIVLLRCCCCRLHAYCSSCQATSPHWCSACTVQSTLRASLSNFNATQRQHFVKPWMD